MNIFSKQCAADITQSSAISDPVQSSNLTKNASDNDTCSSFAFVYKNLDKNTVLMCNFETKYFKMFVFTEVYFPKNLDLPDHRSEQLKLVHSGE